MMTKNRGVPETHPVAATEIASFYCQGLCSLLLKLALQVEGPSTFSEDVWREPFEKGYLKLTLGTKIWVIELNQSCHTKFYLRFRRCRRSGVDGPIMRGIPNLGTWF